jgi:hypothetical protein
MGTVLSTLEDRDISSRLTRRNPRTNRRGKRRHGQFKIDSLDDRTSKMQMALAKRQGENVLRMMDAKSTSTNSTLGGDKSMRHVSEKVRE